MTTDRATLLGLADRCEKASGPDFAIGVEVLRAVGRTGLEVNPLFSLDAALSLAKVGFVAALSELAADGLPGCCICTDTSTSPPKYVWGVSYTPGSVVERLARATTAVAIRALAGKEQGK